MEVSPILVLNIAYLVDKMHFPLVYRYNSTIELRQCVVADLSGLDAFDSIIAHELVSGRGARR